MPLRLIHDRDAERAVSSPAERLYARAIEPMICCVARGADEYGRPELVMEERFLTEDDPEADRIQGFLATRAVISITVEEDRDLPDGGDVLVRVYKKGGRWMAAACRPDGVPSEFFGQQAYVFRSADFPANPYLGMRFSEIRRVLVVEHGEGSDVVRGIDRMIVLTRAILYESLEGRALVRTRRKLKRLLLQIGPAARAVIADFERDYRDNEGWTTVLPDTDPDERPEAG